MPDENALASMSAVPGGETPGKPKRTYRRRTKAAGEAPSEAVPQEGQTTGETEGGERPKRPYRRRKQFEGAQGQAEPTESVAVAATAGDPASGEAAPKRRRRRRSSGGPSADLSQEQPHEEAQGERHTAPQGPARQTQDTDGAHSSAQPTHRAEDQGEQRQGRRPDDARQNRGKRHPGESQDRRQGWRQGNPQQQAQQQGGNRRRNRRDRDGAAGGSLPSVTREQLSEMLVAELRVRAAEMGVEYVGVRRARLVEDVYAAVCAAEGFKEVEGILEIGNEGYGWVRTGNYMSGDDDAFVQQSLIRQLGLRPGDRVAGTMGPGRANSKYPPLVQVRSVNGHDPEDLRQRPRFRDLTPIFPNERLVMENGKDSVTGRAIDLVAPIGKGQRGLIVSPPKAGKTTVLKRICQSIAANNPEVHLFCLLVDERPEEVTDMERSIRGEVVASTFDMPPSNHTAVAELVIEHAKRLVEMGEDVVVVLDSITRLARAYNIAAPASGRILSGGVDSAALYPPKKFLGAARNIENGGSLTIIASALVDTGSKMDEVIFEEFKGTGNMELKLDRDLADKRIFPAIDPVASGTRNEDLLIASDYQPFVWGIRRILANMNNTERAANALVKGLKGTTTNEEFLIRSAKKAQQTDYVA